MATNRLAHSWITTRRFIACPAIVALVLLVASPAVSSARSSSGVTLVHQFQFYAGEQGLGVGFGSLWVGGADDGESVDRVNLATARSVSIHAPSAADVALEIGPTAVWVSDFDDGIVRRIDPSQNRVTAVTKGLPGPALFGFSGTHVWVGLHHGQSVDELDGTSGRVLTRIPVPQGGMVADGPSDVAVGLGSLWTNVINLGAIVRLNPATHKVVAVIHDGTDCCSDVSVAGAFVWSTSSASIDRIDPTTNTVTMRIHLNHPLLASPGVLNGELWAASSDEIIAIDPATGKIVSRTKFRKAFFNELVVGDGALFAWNANTNQVDELQPS
jgi:streptogramin lyase